VSVTCSRTYSILVVCEVDYEYCSEKKEKMDLQCQNLNWTELVEDPESLLLARVTAVRKNEDG